MRRVILISIALGFGWSLIAMYLMGGRPTDAWTAGYAIGGVFAGIVAGRYTIWSRERTDGYETFTHGISNYYLAIVTYWVTMVVVERIRMCIQYGGWTSFDLRDQLMVIVWFLILGTFPYGLILIPLTFASRYVVWKAYLRS